ncbi:MAG: heme A synthase [Paenibacillaceae bacterium]|uniref:Heme A synthase n=1 Tax=Paenibacillus mellifer TaxID=2937794 RepID=A0A9X2BQP9_9BACL|nr:heme A synthase [Paenibacillus mellifer]MBW4839293.1 heme A synthase [Paenibacillaceae bacterium]MCK8489334.1 heme A synthase [Paenibacillus mellifer]
MNTKYLKWLSYASCFVMFLATLGGSVVTKTESGLGCGNDWPLCHGKFVPAHTLASMIEYSHRAVSGAAGLVSLAAFVAFWLYRKNRKDLQLYSLLALIFVMVQAVMGAMAVIYPTSSAVMALHFGFSLIAFASSIMLVLGVRQEERGQAGTPSHAHSPAVRVSKRFRNLTWIATGYTYIVVYIGAYVSHTDSAGGCSGWPLCNGQLVPELSGGEGIAFMHRVAAALLLVVIATVGHFAFRKHPGLPEIRKLGVAATLLVIIQVFTGATIVLTLNNYHVYLFASLAHIIVLAALFGVLCYLSVRTWQLSRTSA